MSRETQRTPYGCATGNLNAIFDQLSACLLTQLQYHVILELFRRSYGNAGYQLATGTGDGRMAQITNHRGLAEHLHMTPAAFSKTCKELTELGICIREGKAIGINMEFGQWRMDVIGADAAQAKYRRNGAGRPSTKTHPMMNTDTMHPDISAGGEMNSLNTSSPYQDNPVNNPSAHYENPVNNTYPSHNNPMHNTFTSNDNPVHNFREISGLSVTRPHVALAQAASPAVRKRRKPTKEDDEVGTVSVPQPRSSPSVALHHSDDALTIQSIQSVTQMLPQNIALLVKQFHPRLSSAHIVTALAACAEFHRAKHPDAPILLKQAQGWLERELRPPTYPNRLPSSPPPLPAAAVTAVIPPTSKKYRHVAPLPSPKGGITDGYTHAG